MSLDQNDFSRLNLTTKIIKIIQKIQNNIEEHAEEEEYLDESGFAVEIIAQQPCIDPLIEEHSENTDDADENQIIEIDGDRKNGPSDAFSPSSKLYSGITLEKVNNNQ